MEEELVLLLHGFASSGNSTKAQFLRERFLAVPGVEFFAFDFNPTPRDFEFMTVTGMINRLRQFLVERRRERVFLVGSSMGALVGLNYAHRFGGVRRMLLLAPALAYRGSERVERVFHFAFQREISLREGFFLDAKQYAQPVPPPAPLTIVHGRHDEVIPIAFSREYAAAYPDDVQLIDVESDHRLNDQLDLIWQRLSELVQHRDAQ